MAWYEQLPLDLLNQAERRSWFSHDVAMQILDWIELEGHGLLGIETAKKIEGSNWILLSEPMLTTGLGSGDMADTRSSRDVALQKGRDFLSNYEGSDLMFEPVW